VKPLKLLSMVSKDGRLPTILMTRGEATMRAGKDPALLKIIFFNILLLKYALKTLKMGKILFDPSS
jgi:hypothetical protein